MFTKLECAQKQHGTSTRSGMDVHVYCLRPFATIRSVHCRWAATQEPLSMQGRVLERRTGPDE